MTRRPVFALAAAATLLLCSAASARDEPAAKGKGKPVPTEAERMAAAAKRFDRFDKDKNATLAGKEIPKRWLVAYDRNGDGKIGRKEFLKLQKRPAKLRHVHYMRDPVARARRTLTQFDRNKDGLVQRDEYPGSNSQFRQADRSKDNALSLRELLRRSEDELKDIRRRMKRPNRREFLDFFDIDRNRRIGPEEYDGNVAVFRKYDKNGDGTVTYYELYPEYAARDRRTAELTRPKAEDLNVVEAMDKNGDKRVSRKEWKGTDAAWRRLDRNRDGYISLGDAH